MPNPVSVITKITGGNKWGGGFRGVRLLLDSEVKQSVINEAVRIIETLPDEELNENVLAHRSEVAHFAKKTITLWLKFP